MATWAPIVFWILLVPLIVTLFVVYLRSKKLYRLTTIATVFTYAMFVMYWIDAYRLSRNAIIGLLALSSLLMIGWGYLIHKEKKQKPSRKNAIRAAVSIVLILVIIGLTATNIGITVEESTVPSVAKTKVLQYSAPEDRMMRPRSIEPIPLHTITVTNNFFPRQYELPRSAACLISGTERMELPIKWRAAEDRGDLSFGRQDYLELGYGEKSATLVLDARPFLPKGEKAVYDHILLVLEAGDTDDGRYISCWELTPEQISSGRRIPLV